MTKTVEEKTENIKCDYEGCENRAEFIDEMEGLICENCMEWMGGT